MGEPLKAQTVEIKEKPQLRSKEEIGIIDKINNTHTVELVITLCGFVGTDIHGVGQKLKEILEQDFGYEVKIIRLSHLIKSYSDLAKNLNSSGISGFEYTKKLIDGGNELRRSHENNVLASLAIQQISFERIAEQKKEENTSFKSRRVCYIIDSIKNTNELELFQTVYREIHYSIGIFSPIDEREKNLKNRGMSDPEVSQLIDRDSGEELANGQKVRDTFIRSDYFLRVESDINQATEEKLKRFINLIFGSKVITPTHEETAMYHAASAANNSACLSRQVGAALTDAKGEILSIGWNDVPKAGGGLYQSNTKDLLGEGDKRCWNLGDKGCWNDDEKNLMTNELVNIVIKEIKEQFGEETKIDTSRVYQKIRGSKIKSLVEFSRAIHAEMHAIITGCQTAGDRVRGGSLYITTYPCHNCARHIIVAGIKRVYYIEPYRKSLTTKLHFDAITEIEDTTGKVIIIMYDGVAPSRYMELFKMAPDSRKQEDGKKRKYNLQHVKPKSTLSLEAIPVLESEIVKELEKRGLKLKT